MSFRILYVGMVAAGGDGVKNATTMCSVSLCTPKWEIMVAGGDRCVIRVRGKKKKDRFGNLQICLTFKIKYIYFTH